MKTKILEMLRDLHSGVKHWIRYHTDSKYRKRTDEWRSMWKLTFKQAELARRRNVY